MCGTKTLFPHHYCHSERSYLYSHFLLCGKRVRCNNDSYCLHEICMISNSVKSIQCSPFCFSGVSVRQMLACLPSIQSSRLPHDSIQPLETSQREYVAQGKLNMPKTIKTGRTFAAFVLQHAGCSNSLGACPERTSCTLLSIVCSYGFRSVKPQMTCLVRQLAGGLLLVLSFVCVKSIMMS